MHIIIVVSKERNCFNQTSFSSNRVRVDDFFPTSNCNVELLGFFFSLLHSFSLPKTVFVSINSTVVLFRLVHLLTFMWQQFGVNDKNELPIIEKKEKIDHHAKKSYDKNRNVRVYHSSCVIWTAQIRWFTAQSLKSKECMLHDGNTKWIEWNQRYYWPVYQIR